VFFGMLGVTFFGLLLTPVFYVILRKLSGGKRLRDKHGRRPHVHGPDERDGNEHSASGRPVAADAKVREPALQD
jgi:multidrug efflux pump